MISDPDEMTSRRLIVLKERAHSRHEYLRDLARQKLREFPSTPEHIGVCPPEDVARKVAALMVL